MQYLSTDLDKINKDNNWPKVLIISDASGHGNPKSFRAKVDLVSFFSGAQDISFELLHREIYALLTGHPDYLQWLKQELPQVEQLPDLLQWLNSKQELLKVEQFHTVPYRNLIEGKPKGNLITIAIPATSEVMATVIGTQCKYTEAGKPDSVVTAVEIQAEVRDYPTLYELDPEQVRKAFWLGKVLGKTYYKAIMAAIAKSRGLDSSFLFSFIQPHLECPSSDIELPLDTSRQLEKITSQQVLG